MSPDGSITRLVALLKSGDRMGAQRLWEVYFPRLVALARGRLRGVRRGVADEEDVALSALESFYRRAERGEFPRLQDRHDLWQLLFVLAVRKAINLARHEGRPSRGAGRVRSLSDIADWDDLAAISPEPTPELAAQFAEECRRLLASLDDETLRSVALWKMDGCTNNEIASRLDCVPQTVERKLRAIRRLWAGEAMS